MISNRLSIYGLISVAALVSGVLVGCGGSSASLSGIHPSVADTGGVTTGTGATATTQGPFGQPTQVQVTINGSPAQAVIPAGTTISPGTPFAVVTNTQPFINGLTPSHKGKPMQGTGQILINGQPTGLTETNGVISGNIALPQGNYTLSISGPFTITSSTDASFQLTVGEFIFGINSNGTTCSVPAKVNMLLPANGGSTYGDNFVTVTEPFTTGTVKLILVTSNWTKIQSGTVDSGGNFTFKDFNSDPSDIIPASGLTSIEFDYTQ